MEHYLEECRKRGEPEPDDLLPHPDDIEVDTQAKAFRF